ncbi:acyl-CoA thioesterase [Gordonia rhizosphera]|uniref:Putative acyl-CoA thioesterase n=1 Tax=Gordonia rhizosphera NBRC 16068 TaxID=1108045 RepID=K6WSK5_9ACTN|nr:acyl-CoA thioesterase domain-containing protein [Gordonia rhizosphera]GAB89549.1 putative acyl-CoA thioesterase [Gordonia rhizosphera NBRC 16068]
MASPQSQTVDDLSLDGLVDSFDVSATGDGSFAGTCPGSRPVVEGTHLMGQSIIAAAKVFSGKSIRSAQGVFTRTVQSSLPVEFAIDVVHDGRSLACADIAVVQNGRRCAMVSVLADQSTADVIRHQATRPGVAGPSASVPSRPPFTGAELRLVDVVDVNDPEEVGPPELYAWLRYDSIPARGEFAKALLTYPTGGLGISTSMRPHRGVGTSQSHRTISTGVITASITFHEPLTWDGWLLYSHESTYAGSGLAYIRGQVHTESGTLLASFTQQAMIRPMAPRPDGASAGGRL